MNIKQLIITLCLGLFLLPISLRGQASQNITTEQGAKTAQFMKGSGDFESWFMEAFTKIDMQMDGRANDVLKVGKAIAAIGMLIYLAVIGFRMQSGAAEWSVEPMIKPIIVGLLLINWVPFTKMIQAPLQMLSEPSEAIFKDIERETNARRTFRYTKQMQVLEATINLNATILAKQKGFWSSLGDGEISQAFGNLWDKITAPIEEVVERANYKMQKLLGDCIEMVCLIILRVAVYFIFFIQKVWSYILIVLGPIAVGISFIPGFESSFYNWISKFININLYTFIAYTIINIGQQIIIAGYEMDISRLSAIVDNNGAVINQGLLLTYTTYNGMATSIVFPCVGYLVTAIGVLMTPTIADAIISAGGAGVMTKVKQAASNVTNVAKNATSRTGKGISNFIKGTPSLNPHKGVTPKWNK
ncbi:hypothetical protein [uncultured Capnocytophaga sp.]|uniref:hypothetical protein n=1 Tax=uncultured Capnocytophaga sp. TaxID=159273 RepID=UPI002603EDB6|nr:hypothetical protein [uncultured Capnocytophaga sp.]